MTTVLVDPAPEQGDVRQLLYEGDLVVFTRVAAVDELIQFAREQLWDLFAPHNPEESHLYFAPEETAGLLATWKPSFMRHDRSKRLLGAIVEEVGFSPRDTHVDLLKARTAFPLGHLSTGIAFAFPWHRDTWYSAPAQQINWWLPIFELARTNAMKFDVAKFDVPVSNTSAGFDYYEINRSRGSTAAQTRVETQARPATNDHQTESEIVVLPRVGSVLLFSGEHLHATIPNQSGRSRFSIDFRTVDRRDVVHGVGAPIVDADCTGTSLRDFVSLESGAPFDEDLVRALHGTPPSEALLVFSPDTDARR